MKGLGVALERSPSRIARGRKGTDLEPMNLDHWRGSGHARSYRALAFIARRFGVQSLVGDEPRHHIELYTDGACSGNPGPGGWAFVLRHRASGRELERAGAERLTTNNRMELLAVIEGLSALREPSVVDLYSDSQYVLKGLEEWMEGWKRKGWRTAAKKPVKNQDLWQRLDELKSLHDVRFHWIRGHEGHPENERCDALAVAAREALAARG